MSRRRPDVHPSQFQNRFFYEVPQSQFKCLPAKSRLGDRRPHPPARPDAPSNVSSLPGFTFPTAQQFTQEELEILECSLRPDTARRPQQDNDHESRPLKSTENSPARSLHLPAGEIHDSDSIVSLHSDGGLDFLEDSFPEESAGDTRRTPPPAAFERSDLTERVRSLGRTEDRGPRGMRAFPGVIAGGEVIPARPRGQRKLQRVLEFGRPEPLPPVERVQIPGVKETVCAQRFARFMRQAEMPIPAFLRSAE
jgi:hypothetical protein